MNPIIEPSNREEFDSYYRQIKEKSKNCGGTSKPFTDVDEEAVNKASSNAQDYNSIERIERTAKAHRHEIVNKLIEDLEEPLSKEQSSKNAYRKWILIVFFIFFVGITIATFMLLNTFAEKGFDQYTVQVSSILVSGLFVNVVGLAVIIFKYLFDDKNSVLKEMIQLLANTLKGSSH